MHHPQHLEMSKNHSQRDHVDQRVITFKRIQAHPEYVIDDRKRMHIVSNNEQRYVWKTRLSKEKQDP